MTASDQSRQSNLIMTAGNQSRQPERATRVGLPEQATRGGNQRGQPEGEA